MEEWAKLQFRTWYLNGNGFPFAVPGGCPRRERLRPPPTAAHTTLALVSATGGAKARDPFLLRTHCRGGSLTLPNPFAFHRIIRRDRHPWRS